MEFFDLNVPYYESDRNITEKDRASRKATRLKLVVKAMELGYGGIAYNRILKGVMSDLDRCSIPLFPLSSLTKAAPSISSAVKLHREVLGLTLAAPFRQFTRLTVVVESSSQALALNSGNPILKSYDIIAVRPMNQSAFEQACQTSEVDMISINFSDKMPFRLKHPMVKAAIQRGVYFEITYSGLIRDAQTRRQLISNAKLLVDWTRGKNLIVSSAASSVSEMRGPYDIANLLSLLGLPMERAKAALSKNCRVLLTHAVRKKHYYKEAIRVELIPSTADSNETKEKQLNEWWPKWDPISSGDGDLLLDDIEKSLSATNLVSKTVKAIDFASSAIERPSLVCEENNRDGLNSKPMDCAKSVTVTSTDAQISFPSSNLTNVETCHVLEDTKMIPDAALGLEDDKMEEDLIVAATDIDPITITKDTVTNVSSRPSIPESSAEEQRMETAESKEMDVEVMGELTYNEDHDLGTTNEQKRIENQNESNSTRKFDKFPGKIRLKPRKHGDGGIAFPLRRLLVPINFKRKARRKSMTVIQLM